MKDILLQRLKEKLQEKLNEKFRAIKEKGISGLKNRSFHLQREIREKTIGYILAGLGVVAGLAWNDAIGAFINYFFPLSKNEVWAKFFYALILTIIVVVVTTYLMKMLEKNEENKSQGS